MASLAVERAIKLLHAYQTGLLGSVGWGVLGRQVVYIVSSHIGSPFLSLFHSYPNSLDIPTFVTAVPPTVIAARWFAGQASRGMIDQTLPEIRVPKALGMDIYTLVVSSELSTGLQSLALLNASYAAWSVFRTRARQPEPITQFMINDRKCKIVMCYNWIG